MEKIVEVLARALEVIIHWIAQMAWDKFGNKSRAREIKFG